MTTLVERSRKWGEELNQQRIEQGERDLVLRLVARRFGPGTADNLAPLLADASDSDRITAIVASGRRASATP